MTCEREVSFGRRAKSPPPGKRRERKRKRKREKEKERERERERKREKEREERRQKEQRNVFMMDESIKDSKREFNERIVLPKGKKQKTTDST